MLDRDGDARWWSRRGVRDRAVVVVVLVVGIALTATGAVLVSVLGAQLTGAVQESVAQRTRDVAAQVGSDDEDAAVATLAAEPGDTTLLQVVAPDGQVLLSSPSIQGEPPMLDPQTAAAVGDSGGTVTVGLPFVDNDQYVVAVAPAVTPQGTVVVEGAQSLVPVQRVTRTVAIGFAAAVPFLLLTVAWIAWWAVGRSLGSVERIRERVESVEVHGIASERVPVPPTKDEVARLATTMNHMLDRLDSAAKSQRQFVADAGHELKSPLASMRASIDVAVLQGDDPQAWRDAGPVLGEEVDRMSRLVADLLLLASADEGALLLRTTPMDLDDLVLGEVSRLRAQTPLQVEAQVVPVQVLADPDRMGRALRNLVDNAARFARHRVRLSNGVMPDGSPFIAVDDDGPGIPPQSRPDVVGRFVRLDEHRDRRQGGVGLGLAIASEIMALHGGRLDIGDSPLGGAHLRLVLPAAASTGGESVASKR